MIRYAACFILWLGLIAFTSAEETSLATIVAAKILPADTSLQEVQRFLEPRIPRMPQIEDQAAWSAFADKVRIDVLTHVVFRGEARKWRDYKGQVVWFDAEPGGEGYRLKKVRFEILPKLWIPALLYEPDKLSGKVPATLNVMGHDPKGKDVAYQQIRCINLARRGMLALNVEWFNFGQLRKDGYHHGRMNLLDLVGTSGIAPFYLALERGLDVLLSHPHADRSRVAVSGLSGGGWQTAFISGLDRRVTLANPVAGYSSYLTRIHNFSDLGDSEQTPCDLGMYADYMHLTALRAPRPSLLTFNAKDNCCFASGHALPPLLAGVGPVYRLFGAEKSLESHVNVEPGTHNYEQDNREAFYRMIGTHFFPGSNDFSAQEIPCDNEIRQPQDLVVPMPDFNHDFQTLALSLARSLPRQEPLPETRSAANIWQGAARETLARLVRYRPLPAQPKLVKLEASGSTIAASWLINMGEWTLPVLELRPPEAKGTVLILNEKGRAAALKEAEQWLAREHRVVLVDPFYLGEQDLGRRAYLWALMIGTVGERPLGLQASQIAALARWARVKDGSIRIVAQDEVSGLIALAAGALETRAIGAIDLRQSLASLKEVIERSLHYQQRPEYFCFGLLEQLDVLHLAALNAPRPVRFDAVTDRHRSELAPLTGWYRTLGTTWQPLGGDRSAP